MAYVREAIREFQFEHPVLMVGWLPGATDLVRRPDGKAQWRTIDDGRWYVQILGEAEMPREAATRPLDDMPDVFLRADPVVSSLNEALVVDLVDGQLAVTSVAT